ncbi:MAG: LPS export ABC transporter periplasmic protein LptC [Betaproteobacteria bacterium]
MLLAGLATLTWWLDQTVQPLDSEREKASKDDPDFVVDKLEATRMNLDGTQRYSVIATKMVHYPGDNSAVLDQPHLIHFDPNTAPVSIRANQGVLSSNGENAYFSGDVQVKRAPYGKNPELSLYTSFLHVIPDRDEAKTDRAVTITSGNSTLKGVGLELNNKTHEMKLLSDVKGQIETPAKSRRPLPWEHKR